MKKITLEIKFPLGNECEEVYKGMCQFYFILGFFMIKFKRK